MFLCNHLAARIKPSSRKQSRVQSLRTNVAQLGESYVQETGKGEEDTSVVSIIECIFILKILFGPQLQLLP